MQHTGIAPDLASFCRTTGGKGLHVVVPLKPEADWSVAKPFCRAFTEALAVEYPTRFLAHLKIADRASLRRLASVGELDFDGLA